MIRLLLFSAHAVLALAHAKPLPTTYVLVSKNREPERYAGVLRVVQAVPHVVVEPLYATALSPALLQAHHISESYGGPFASSSKRANAALVVSYERTLRHWLRSSSENQSAYALVLESDVLLKDEALPLHTALARILDEIAARSLDVDAVYLGSCQNMVIKPHTWSVRMCCNAPDAIIPAFVPGTLLYETGTGKCSDSILWSRRGAESFLAALAEQVELAMPIVRRTRILLAVL